MNYNIINYIKTLSNNEKIQKLLIETVGVVLLKQNDINKMIKENEDKIIHIRDWIASIIQSNEEWKQPRVLTINALNNAADKYFEKQNNKLQTIELNEKDEKLIADLGDYYVVQMLTPEALDNESKQMQHCIGHGWYDERLKDKEYLYISLRDKFNKAHVTLEIYKNIVYQVQGKQNKLPEFKYLEKIFPYLVQNNFELDLSKYNFIINANDNKIYSMFNLPENCKINGHLDYKSQKVKELPKGLEISGTLNLSYSGIDKLPEGLKVGKSLLLRETAINELDDNLTVNGKLDLAGCKNFKKLPKGLVVKGNLNLYDTEIKELPEDIIIESNIDLSNSHITKLPDNFVVNGDLVLEYCENLKELPNGLVVKGSLYSRYTFLKSLPQDIIVLDYLDIGNSDIESLPDNLKTRSLSLSHCNNITKLPDNIIVNGSLNLTGSSIEKLPDNLVVNGSFLALNCCNNLKKLPKGLVVKGNLCLENTEIEELPEDIVIGRHLVLNKSNIKRLPNNLKCKNIYIDEKHIQIVKKSIDFQKIFIGRLKEEYTKKEFFLCCSLNWKNNIIIQKIKNFF